MKAIGTKGFKTAFRPFHKHFTRATEAPGLFGEVREWKTIDRYLTDNVIMTALQGKQKVGYFSSAWMGVIGIDIDDHTGKGWAFVLSVYENVINRFHGLPASILARSTSGTGLHAFWILYNQTPAGILIPAVSERLKGIKNVEIRPTPLQSLRIPCEGALIDPVNFKPLTLSIAEALKDPVIYHEAVILDDTTAPGFIRSRLSDRKDKFKLLRASGRLNMAEKAHAPIMQGMTNEAFTGLMPLYRRAGMTIDEAAARFIFLLHPSYQGEMRTYNRVRGKAKSMWRKADTFSHSPRYVTTSLFNEPLARSISSRWAGRDEQKDGRLKQERDTLTRFLTGLYDWMDFIDTVKENPVMMAEWAYLYPYFKKNTKEGYYPIPKAMLRRWAGDPFKFTRWMEREGFLTRSLYQYQAGAGICLYYRVHRPVSAVAEGPGLNIEASNPDKTS